MPKREQNRDAARAKRTPPEKERPVALLPADLDELNRLLKAGQIEEAHQYLDTLPQRRRELRERLLREEWDIKPA